MKTYFALAALLLVAVCGVLGQDDLVAGQNDLDVAQNDVDVMDVTDSPTDVPDVNGTTAGAPHTTAGAESTAAAETTTQPPATTTTPEPVGWWQVDDNNVTCILLTMAGEFNISYTKSDNKTAYTTIVLPANGTSTADGTCATKDHPTEDINIKFFKDWAFSLAFNKSSDQYYLDTMTLKYTETDDKFPGTKNPGTQRTATLTGDKQFKTSKGNSYLCKSESSFDLKPAVTAQLQKMQLQAFMDDAKEVKFGDAQECPADSETSNIVPIAVGAALAGLVVIVLVAYLISRNRNKGGYESV